MEKTQTVAGAHEPAGRPIPEHPDSLLHPSEVALILGIQVRTLETWRLNAGRVINSLPRFVSDLCRFATIVPRGSGIG